MKGDGRVFRRGGQWWIDYYAGSKRVREPAGTSKAKAKAKLKALHRDLRDGAYLAPEQRLATVDDLLDDLVRHLENKGIASIRKARSHLVAVREGLGHARAVELDTSMVEAYQLRRRAAGRAAATINRECELLRQAFRRAANVTPPKVPRVPTIPMLTVDNARQGFLSRADFDALLAAIPDTDLRDYLEFGWWTAMRPGEIRSLN